MTVESATNDDVEAAITGTRVWSIGLYRGKSPFSLKPITAKDVAQITHKDVSDTPAAFVADPFLLQVGTFWYLFMEVMDSQANRGVISLATSEDCVSWRYEQVVLKEEFHLSYPYVFEWHNDFYMIPETLSPGAIRLYKASRFPHEWKHISNLVCGEFADPSIFRSHNKWWLFACPHQSKHSNLNLYFSNNLSGPYLEHPMNPIVDGNQRMARPGGRVIQHQDKLLRFAQDCYPEYGKAVRAFEIEYLTTTDYQETEVAQSPVYGATGKGWNSDGMHHIDARRIGTGEWIAAVDGYCLDFTAY